MQTPESSAAQGRLSDRAEYPKDCPNCGLWLTAESMDCPRCMAKLSPSSGAGSVGRSGDTDGLLPEGLVSPPASDSPAAQDHEIEACFHNGEYWTVICSCAWEGWNMPTERAARAIHADHVCDPEPDFPNVRTFQ